MTKKHGHNNSTSIDHINAKILGGDNSHTNLQVCCTSCNHEKAKLEFEILSFTVIRYMKNISPTSHEK